MTDPTEDQPKIIAEFRLTTFQPSPFLSEASICPNFTFVLRSDRPMPGRFIRFIHRWVFGVYWRPVNGGKP